MAAEFKGKREKQCFFVEKEPWYRQHVLVKAHSIISVDFMTVKTIMVMMIKVLSMFMEIKIQTVWKGYKLKCKLFPSAPDFPIPQS